MVCKKAGCWFVGGDDLTEALHVLERDRPERHYQKGLAYKCMLSPLDVGTTHFTEFENEFACLSMFHNES